jgi:hypothetical protein
VTAAWRHSGLYHLLRCTAPQVDGRLLAGGGEAGGSGVVTELTSFLRKANRQLRQASLVALEVGWSWS